MQKGLIFCQRKREWAIYQGYDWTIVDLIQTESRTAGGVDEMEKDEAPGEIKQVPPPLMCVCVSVCVILFADMLQTHTHSHTQ